jgi:hypothetical protein
LERPSKSSKSDPRCSATIWEKSNVDYKYGESFLSKIELEKVGPWCVALHAWYIKECEEGRLQGLQLSTRKTISDV